jgi:hypothetical protein
VLPNIFRPTEPEIAETPIDPNWEATCEPGRLWLVMTVRPEETIFELRIAYLTRGPKLICAPRPAEALPSAPQLLRSSPSAQAREALKHITGLDANWSAIGSQPPNEKAYGLAQKVLETIFSTKTRKPSVTASAEGGIAIVYKENGSYVAIECLNRGSVWMLWFLSNGEPQSRRVTTSQKALEQAIE